jgi:sterol desaturase/sphingolipid hydroxylase (fatty acid hydroxylase superfamily)
MEIFESFLNEIVSFFGIRNFFQILNSGDFASFLTYDDIVAIIQPILPLLLVLEFIMGMVHKNPQTKVYQTIFLIYVFNRFLGRFIAIAMTTICIGLFQKHAPYQTTMTWYWFIYGYIVWEFAHFIYHYLGHKVRLFWCLHATHHTPEQMNLSVAHAHFFLEAPYADVIRTSVCILLGVHPALLFVIMFVDGTYGTFIHVGENLMKNGRLGFLNKIILTPSHHRVHHARNPLYIDTNYCNFLNIWDKVFKTYQEEQKDIDIEYGITREINSGNFIDVYFGEFIALFKDVVKAPGLINKLAYIFLPPGWDHTGNHRTAKMIRDEYIEQIQQQQS